jgi:hypothetical protein
LGDQYLARVYRLVSQRFHLEDWDASILRKLETLESIYGKMSDRAHAPHGAPGVDYYCVDHHPIAVSFMPWASH